MMILDDNDLIGLMYPITNEDNDIVGYKPITKAIMSTTHAGFFISLSEGDPTMLVSFNKIMSLKREIE